MTGRLCLVLLIQEPVYDTRSVDIEQDASSSLPDVWGGWCGDRGGVLVDPSTSRIQLCTGPPINGKCSRKSMRKCLKGVPFGKLYLLEESRWMN
jgi:hypothetical protein